MHLPSGTLLKRGEYRIISTLGRGGFGITYIAEQVNLHRKVCIKEFFPKDYYKRDEDSVSISLLSDSFKENMSRFKSKFIKEAQTIAALDHANIIHIHDVFEENGTAYYVMDYVDGESLSARVKSVGALSERDAVGYIKQVAAALEYIHEQQIMHLDVKPGNIMVRTKGDHAILIDFGLSKHYDSESGEATSTTPVGVSHGFAPMEQYQDGGVSTFSPETDIYSLGATLYYLVTGNVPPQATVVAEQGLPQLGALSSNVREAIERSMSYLRKDRPHTIKEFLALLDNVEPVVEVLVADDERTKITAVTDGEKTKIVASQPKVEQPKVQIDREPKLKLKTERPKRRWWQWLLGLLVTFALYINFGLLAAGCCSLCVFGSLLRFRWWQWLLGYLVLIGFAFLYVYHLDMEKMEHAVEARNAEKLNIEEAEQQSINNEEEAEQQSINNEEEAEQQSINDEEEAEQPNNEIWYTTSKNGGIEINTEDLWFDLAGEGLAIHISDKTQKQLFGAEIKNHIYGNCNGRIIFDGDITSIGVGMFCDSKNLTTISIPNSVQIIDAFAFYRCENLTDVVLPNGVTEFSSCAFSDCYNMQNIFIPNSVITIGEDAFSNCRKLTSVNIPNSVKTIGNGAFRGCTSIRSIYIPDSITTINASVFYCCENLVNVIIPDKVTTIEEYAFSSCSSLATITIPDNVTTIGGCAFSECDKLTSITISHKVTTIGWSVFGNCQNLKSVYCKATTPPSLGDHSFIYMDNGEPRQIDCTIYVPRGSVEAYKNAEGWREYADNIVGYNF